MLKHGMLLFRSSLAFDGTGGNPFTLNYSEHSSHRSQCLLRGCGIHHGRITTCHLRGERKQGSRSSVSRQYADGALSRASHWEESADDAYRAKPYHDRQRQSRPHVVIALIAIEISAGSLNSVDEDGQ